MEKKQKTSEGAEIPIPKRGRLLQESEESRHAFSGPPSEEVTSQLLRCHARP